MNDKTTRTPTDEELETKRAHHERFCDRFMADTESLVEELAGCQEWVKSNAEDGQFDDVIADMKALHSYLTKAIDKAENRFEQIMDLEDELGIRNRRSGGR